MRLAEILSNTLELLQHPEFTNFGDLVKHKKQIEITHNEEERALRRELNKGTKQDPKVVAKMKKKVMSKESQESRRKKVKEWYENPENRKYHLKKTEEGMPNKSFRAK